MGAQESSECKGKVHFTFIWAIENVLSPLENNFVESPYFVAVPIENTHWKMTYVLHSNGFIEFTIMREDNRINSIEIEFEMSLLTADGSPIGKINHIKELTGKDGIGLRIPQNREEVFVKKRAEFLPNDTLTVRCRMWKIGMEVSKPDTCFARTRLSVDRHSFVWAVREFSNILSGQKITHYLNPLSSGSPQIKLCIFLSGKKNGKSYASMQKDEHSATRNHVFFCKFSVLDDEGKVVHSKEMQYFIFPGKKLFGGVFTFTEFIEKDLLLNYMSSLLPNDVLSLKCDFFIDAELISNRIENYINFTLREADTIMSELHEKQLDEQGETSIACCSFKKAFLNLYNDSTFSDVSLRAGGRSFPAHEIVLSARSPVFKAMFTQEMSEKTSKYINISDMNGDTLNSLLLYIYKGTIPDLQWETAIDLFKAAGNYQLWDLRKKCFSYLKLNFSVANVCSILPIMEKDTNFRNEAVEFLTRNYKEIFNSDAWRKFKMENFRLASDITERLIILNDRNFFNIVP